MPLEEQLTLLKQKKNTTISERQTTKYWLKKKSKLNWGGDFEFATVIRNWFFFNCII